MEEEIFGFKNNINYQELHQLGEEEDNAYTDEEDDLGGCAFPVGRYKDVIPTKQNIQPFICLVVDDLWEQNVKELEKVYKMLLEKCNIVKPTVREIMDLFLCEKSTEQYTCNMNDTPIMVKIHGSIE